MLYLQVVIFISLFFYFQIQYDKNQISMMKAETEMYFDSNQETQNVILETRKMIKGMSQQQRFQKALKHVNDGLQYRWPRSDAYGPNLPKMFKFAYRVQTSSYWTWIMFICSYIYMYTIILQPNEHFTAKVILQLTCLGIFWFDAIIFLYHKSFETIKVLSKFELRFFIKMGIVTLLTIDVFIFLGTKSAPLRAMRPFRILRGLLPIFYDAITRKNFFALIAAYKDILVYVSFYACVIASFALIGNQIINLPPETVLDQYTNDYTSFVKSIYITYVLSSYDAYPDNQLASIKWNIWVYAYVIIFVLLNIFFFVTVPATIILNSFRQTRSKTILIDEIRQQHSLILAFVSLGQYNYNIETNTLIRFLLYMYKQKVRYMDCITEIYLKMDDNNNGSIQVSGFMQLCKILAKNSQLLPPQFDDWKAWIRFRQWFIGLTNLQKIVQSWSYQFITNFLIILAIVNCIAIINTNKVYALMILDYVFTAIFVVDLLVRFVGSGPQSFLRDQWNKFDCFIVILVLIFSIIPDNLTSQSLQVLLKIFRIYRIAEFVSLFSNEKQKKFILGDSLYAKGRRLFSQVTLIIPIAVKFFSFFLITFYFLGTISMEIFSQVNDNPDRIYMAYSQFSNFSYFMGTQFIMIQTVVQAGWSTVCYNYVVKTGVYAPVYLLFITYHVIIVLILTSLLKGLVWQVYFSVQEQFQQKYNQEIMINDKQQKTDIKRKQFAQIRQIIDQREFIIPNTVVKRQFLQNKLDIQIFKRLKQLYFKSIINHNKSKRRSQIIGQIVLQKKQYFIDKNGYDQQQKKNQQQMNYLYDRIIRQKITNQNILAIEQEDFQQQMQQLMNKLVLHPKIKYSQTIVYPKVLMELLQQKLTRPLQKVMEKGFDMTKVSFNNKDSIQFFTLTLSRLLQIETSSRDQKKLIIKNMTENHLLTEEEAKQLFSKGQTQKNKHIDVNWIIRKMFLHDTNERLIDKFQIQYFSDIYGQSFKQINIVTIEPLLKYEALLTYNLRSIFRYPQIQTNDFFQVLTKIQDRISNNLLKKGSLFKFVYQIQALSGNWFMVEFKDSQQVKIHFIKTGIWMYNKKMQENQIYYARDLFKWDVNQRPDKVTCQKIIKLLYQTFQGLAFGLLNQSQFFTSNAVQNIYDFYSFFVDVSKIQRPVSRKLQITKIMLVLLTKQQQRPDDQYLQYQLSEITSLTNQKKKTVDFKFDQTEKQTFNKLKNFAALDRQKIIQSQGLPFSYVINLMTQVKQILQLYSETLVYQVQKILNQEFENQ